MDFLQSEREDRIHLLAHTSPLGWSHISLTGDYNWEQAAIAVVRYPDAYPKKEAANFSA